MFFYLSLWGLSYIIRRYYLVIARAARLVAIFSRSVIARAARLVAIFSRFVIARLLSRGNLFSFRHCESRKARGNLLLFVIARLLSRGNLPHSALIMRSPRSLMLARDDEGTEGQSDDAEKTLLVIARLLSRGNLLLLVIARAARLVAISRTAR